MKYFITFFSSLAWTFFILENSNTFASASIARPSIYPMDSPRSFLESINGTRNFRMHGKKAKDDKWIWDGREGSRYIYCVREATSKCEELEYTKQCFGQNIPYPSTTLDLTNYFSQDQSLEKLISYQALKHVPKCWSAIQPFLCAVFFPKCEKINNVDMVYLPSLEMCKKTIEPCRILYNSSYFPDFLKCNETNFPSKCNNDAWDMKFNLTGQCLSPLMPVDNPTSSYKDIEGCGLQCKDPLYTDDEHRTIKSTIFYCAIFCLPVLSFAIFTFLIDLHNGFKYSADTIFFVNLCCGIACIGWGIQFIPGFHQDIVCRYDNTLRQGAPNEGDNSWCILVFFLVYYWSMAALCWYVIFTYAAYVKLLKAIGKIQERIDRKEENYFHVFTWTLAAVLTIATLVSSEVDGNSTLGICLVGSVNYHHQVWYVLVPVAISAITANYFVGRLMIILVKVRYSGKNIINGRDSQKIQEIIMKIGMKTIFLDVIMIVIFSIQILKFINIDHWNDSLKNSIICSIKSTYSDDDSVCKILDRPSKLALQIQIILLFVAKLIMASFVWNEATFKTWNRFFRRIFGKETEEPQMYPKHKLIARTYAKRDEYINKNRVSIEISNSHTDPVGLNFNGNSISGSQELDPSFANYLPRAVTRRPAITNFISDSSRRSSIDSEISISVRQLSVESRRNSNDSQVSVKFAQMVTKIERRLRGAKPKRSSRRRDRRKDSSTSMESHHQSTATTARIGRSAMAPINQREINELLARKFMLPSLSQSDKSSQDSHIDMILQQFEMSEQKMIEGKFQTNDFNEEYIPERSKNDVELSDVSGRENVCRSSRASKKSIGSRKSGRHHISRLKKTKRNSMSITKSSVNVLASTKKSNNFELSPMNGDLQGSYSGRSDVGIQTEMPETYLSAEFPTKLTKPEDDDDPMEHHSLLPTNRVFISTASKLRDNEISDSEKLKLLLLPSK